MGYRLIETTTLFGQKRVRWKSTGHNGDYAVRERKKQAALARLKEANKPKHLPRAGTQ